MNRQNIVAAILFATTLSISAHANVSLKNGNFFIGYTDIIYPGGFEPKIERVYNSKTTFSGMFGMGWGNEYEVHLQVAADGSVVAYEYGGGAQNRFTPVGFKKEELDKAVNMIVEAGLKVGEKIDKQKLTNNVEYRNEVWERYQKMGKVKARELPVGTQLVSNRFSYQYITRVQGGYVRAFDSGRVEKFDDTGKLARISDKNNNFIELSYGKDGRLAKLVDNYNRKMFFTFNNQGFLQSIDGENSKRTEYKFNDLGDLVYSKDTGGNVYTFKYDKRHNMTEIGYPNEKGADGKPQTMAMTYYGRDKFESVRSVKDRDGTLTEYSYDTDGSDHNHYSVGVNVKGSDHKAISSSKYEYFIKVKPDGEEWTYRLVTTLDGDKTETTYNECCGLPLLIKHGGEETSFEYDVKGRVTRKSTPTEVTMLKYDQKAGKVAEVRKMLKGAKKQVNWSSFQYDAKANLIVAKNSEGKGVRLFYDPNGRISTMVDQNQRRINFKYNENSKPIEISDPSLGTINVSYTNSGEIKKVDSQAGRKIALQVTSSFQNLLDIIRPAGVNLSF